MILLRLGNQSFLKRDLGPTVFGSLLKNAKSQMGVPSHSYNLRTQEATAGELPCLCPFVDLKATWDISQLLTYLLLHPPGRCSIRGGEVSFHITYMSYHFTFNYRKYLELCACIHISCLDTIHVIGSWVADLL